MSKKVNWATIDKRIRGRRTNWTAEELASLETQLKQLPDNEANVERIMLDQPAIGQPDSEGSEQDAAN